ncbi:hypothetical protein Q5O89_16870 [Peribacillus frigoritolerans]|nr:hypothetical protein [Peribacillus frigoritolerans]
MSINSMIITALTPIAPTAFHEYTGTATTYMTFYTYNQRAGLIADDDEKTTVYSVQLDIFGKGNIETVAQQAKQALKALGFARTSEIEMYESTTKTFRKSISLRVSI